MNKALPMTGRNHFILTRNNVYKKIGNFDNEVLSPNEGLIEIENYIKGWPEKNN